MDLPGERNMYIVCRTGKRKMQALAFFPGLLIVRPCSDRNKHGRNLYRRNRSKDECSAAVKCAESAASCKMSA